MPLTQSQRYERDMLDDINRRRIASGDDHLPYNEREHGTLDDEFAPTTDAEAADLFGAPDVKRNGTKPERPLPPVYSLEELLQDPTLLEPPRALFAPIAYESRTTLLPALPKAGKSTLLTQGIAAATSGGEFLGQRVEPMVALWLALDEAKGDFVRRAQQNGADPTALFVMDEVPDTVDQFARVLAKVNPAVVVVDVLARWWLGHVLNENDPAQIGAFLAPRIRVAREANAAMVLLHHTEKSGRQYRGSTDIAAQVDVIATLKGRTSRIDDADDEEPPDDGRRTLTVLGRAGIRANLTLGFDGIRYSLGDAPLALDRRILRTLTNGSASASELAEILRKRKGDVLEAVRQLRAEGYVTDLKSRITITESGKWHLTT